MSDLPKALNFDNLPAADSPQPAPPDAHAPRALNFGNLPPVTATQSTTPPVNALKLPDAPVPAAAQPPRPLFAPALKEDDPALLEAQRIAPEIAQTKAFQSQLTELLQHAHEAVLAQWGAAALESCRTVSEGHTALTSHLAQLRVSEWINSTMDMVLKPPSVLGKLVASVKGETPESAEAMLAVIRGRLQEVLRLLAGLKDNGARAKRELRNDHLAMAAFLAARRTADARLEQVASNRLSLLNAAMQQQALDETAGNVLRDQVMRYLNDIDKLLDVTLPAWKRVHALR